MAITPLSAPHPGVRSAAKKSSIGSEHFPLLGHFLGGRANMPDEGLLQLMPDEGLLQLMQCGDTQAWGELYRRHEQRILNFLFGLLLSGHKAKAEDLKQETFITAYRAAPNWRAKGRVSSWLFGIAYNVYRNGHGNAREVAIEELGWENEEGEKIPFDPPDLGKDTEASVIARGELERIQKLFSRLNPRDAAAVHLTLVEDRSSEEIAKILGCPPGTVRRIVHTFRTILKAN